MLNFTKMHGLGNDFVIIDGISQSIDPIKLPIQKLADRHLGIGFDQLLLIKPSKKADFSCVIFNADGGEAEQCGNGIRCVARFIREKKLSDKVTLSIETKGGIVETMMEDGINVRVNMGLPQFDPKKIPFKANQTQNLYEISLDDHQTELRLSVLSMGNPHAILQVDSLKNFPVEKFGSLISSHPLFPNSTNVGFMEIINDKHIQLRTFERGTGETLACGTNSCAAVISGIKNNLLQRDVTVELILGKLQVQWNSDEGPVFLTGPTEFVFSGVI